MFVCAVQFFAEVHPVTDESAGRFLGEDEPAKSLLCCKSVLDLSGLTPNRHIGPPPKTTEITHDPLCIPVMGFGTYNTNMKAP